MPWTRIKIGWRHRKPVCSGRRNGSECGKHLEIGEIAYRQTTRIRHKRKNTWRCSDCYSKMWL